jgi:hypothetical protein
MLCILLLLFGHSQAWFGLPPLFDDTCAMDRPGTLVCVRKFVDTNHDEVITRAEVIAAIDKYTTPIIRKLAWFVGVDRVFVECDYDRNGVITMRDFELSTRTCMSKKTDICRLAWFCERAEQMNHAKY